VFHLQNITLLQPEHVIEPRLPGGTDALAQYIQTIKAALTAHYASSPASGPRSLVLAVGPGGRAQFWLASDGDLPSDERLAVEGISSMTATPAVNGPIILALLYSAGATPTAQQGLAMPTEWRAIATRANGPVSVDDIVAQLWSEAAS
jgi:hypothetical protein